jgi:hypothetical protein
MKTACADKNITIFFVENYHILITVYFKSKKEGQFLFKKVISPFMNPGFLLGDSLHFPLLNQRPVRHTNLL